MLKSIYSDQIIVDNFNLPEEDATKHFTDHPHSYLTKWSKQIN